MKRKLGFALLPTALVGAAVSATCPGLLPDKVALAVADRQDFQPPDRLRLDGWIGSRVTANEANRLARLDTATLLEGYRTRPGLQAWDGEHVGKWLHAATLAWMNTGDPALRKKLDETAAALCRCQLSDGYLGTYLFKDRWTAWDVWAHKYNLIGLLTYMRYTGNTTPLATCRRMGDLLCRTFGDEPGKRDILLVGYHTGMASTSVLEPMVLLYRLTGEPRYRDFCDYILRAWEKPDGPHIISTLLTSKRVDKVGNGKAYEMLSCLNGALEYYRTFGDPKILEACRNAWRDIVGKRLYITGTASYLEFFHDDFDLPNVDDVGETCVTVTWLQFNAQLLRLTGEARFAEQLECTVMNQLFGAQRPDCGAWGYYVQMEGTKPYSDVLHGHCCLSSGPRGVALIPTFAASVDDAGVVVNLYAPAKGRFDLRDGTNVDMSVSTQYPSDEQIAITVDPARPAEFAVKLRIPAWCAHASVAINDQRMEPHAGADGYVALRRTWSTGDKIELRLKLEPRVIVGDRGNAGRAAICYGPLVLAADTALLESGEAKLSAIALANADLTALDVAPEPAPEKLKTWPDARVFRVHALRRKAASPDQIEKSIDLRLIPFADAGATGSRYRVWLPLLGGKNFNLSPLGREQQSRKGKGDGSIVDGNPMNGVSTDDGAGASEDWFAVNFSEPLPIQRVAFFHGKTVAGGGWFDASAGKPRVQVQRREGGDWETIGELAGYPATTATGAAKLGRGENFGLHLKAPLRAIAVRVIGVPACGNNPGHAFASCGDLQVFSD